MIDFTVMTSVFNPWLDENVRNHNELIQIVAENNIFNIEIFCTTFLNNNELLQLYKNETKNCGVSVPIMDISSNFALPNGSERTKVYDNLKRYLDICGEFNTKIAHICGCYLPEFDTPSECRKRIAEGLNDFIDEVEERGMILAFEDFDISPNLICSANDCLEILSLSDDRVKFVFDTGNFEAAFDHAEEHFDKFIDRTVHFHFKDLVFSTETEKFERTTFGEGIVKNGEIAKLIKEANFSGGVTLETMKYPNIHPKDSLPKDLEIIRNMF